MDAWGDSTTLGMFAPSLAGDPEVGDWWAQIVRSGASPAAASTIGQMYLELDVRPLLETINVPTLVLYRKDDKMVPPRLTRTVAEGIEGARLVELEGADHLFLAGDQRAMLDEVEEFLTGTRPAPASDRVLATTLFTDLVGSTVRATELGDAGWAALLERHDAAVRQELTRFGGEEIDTAGDGFLALFDGPARAIRCGVAIRAALAALGLQVRVGVHTGEVERRSGTKPRGIAVHVGARVMALGSAGDVLVSSTTHDLVAGSGLEFEDRGEHVLKGVEGPRRVYAVAG